MATEVDNKQNNKPVIDLQGILGTIRDALSGGFNKLGTLDRKLGTTLPELGAILNPGAGPSVSPGTGVALPSSTATPGSQVLNLDPAGINSILNPSNQVPTNGAAGGPFGQGIPPEFQNANLNIKKITDNSIELFDDRPVIPKGPTGSGPVESIAPQGISETTPQVLQALQEVSVDAPELKDDSFMQKIGSFLSSPAGGALMGKLAQALSARNPNSFGFQAGKIGQDINEAAQFEELTGALRNNLPVDESRLVGMSPEARAKASLLVQSEQKLALDQEIQRGKLEELQERTEIAQAAQGTKELSLEQRNEQFDRTFEAQISQHRDRMNLERDKLAAAGKNTDLFTKTKIQARAREAVKAEMRILGLNAIAIDIDNLITSFNGIPDNLKGPYAGRTLGEAGKTEFFGDQPELKSFEAAKGFMLSLITRRFGGEVGVLTDKDVDRAKQFLPAISDSRKAADEKIRQLRIFIASKLEAEHKRATIGPEGLSAEDIAIPKSFSSPGDPVVTPKSLEPVAPNPTNVPETDVERSFLDNLGRPPNA